MDECFRVGGIATINCVPILFKNIINFLFGLAAIVGVFFIVISGLKFLTSGGDPVRVEQAKRTMTYAVVGIVIVVLSFAIIKVIANVTSTECINKFNLVDCK